MTVVTGAAGFIGSRLVRRLVELGHPTVGIDNFDPMYAATTKQENLAGLEPSLFRLEKLDVCDREALAAILLEVKPTSLFHLAALAGVRTSFDAPWRYARVNVEGTACVLDAAQRAEIPTLCFASSSSVYGARSDSRPFSEQDVLMPPESPYAATKRGMELLSEAMRGSMRIANLRLFTVFGPAQRPDLAIARFLAAAEAGQPIELFGDPRTARDYTYVDDIVDGFLLAEAAMASRPPGVVTWNLGSDRPKSLQDLVDAVRAVTGRDVEVRQGASRRGDVPRTWADISKARAELGYEPRFEFVEGIRRQWEAFRSAR